MTLWRKVGTLFRASAHEPLEQLVDANALRIMEQELRDTEHAMLQAKRELAGLMATIKQLQRSNEQLSADLAQREAQARQALERDEAGLAYELAEWIAAQENQLQQQRQQAEQLQRQETSLREQLRRAAQMRQWCQRHIVCSGLLQTRLICHPAHILPSQDDSCAFCPRYCAKLRALKDL